MEISAGPRTYHHFSNHKNKEVRSQLYEEQCAVSKSEKEEEGWCASNDRNPEVKV